MEETIRALLIASGAVSAFVGSRVNWVEHPQGAPYPCIVLHGVSDVEEYNLQGPVGVSDARVQCDCLAHSYGEAKRLSRAVRSVLGGYRGGTLQGVFLVNVRGGTRPDVVGAERIFRVSMDFMVKYSTGE